MRAVILATMAVVAGILLAAPANADPDTDFSNELHVYGIYGSKDYNAWIGKLTCKRLATGLDANAYESAMFLQDEPAEGHHRAAGLPVPRMRPSTTTATISGTS